MARQEQDREDLLREATALIERAEVQLPHDELPTLLGFRRDGSFSIYFAGDFVYQFNSNLELRRAHVHGLLYKAEKGRLVEIERRREPGCVALIRRPLSSEEQATFLAQMRRRLSEFAAALQ